MIGILLDHCLGSPLIQELFLILFQFDIDDRTVRLFGHRFGLILAFSICWEHIGLFFPRFLGDHINLVRDHKHRVESYPELSDQIAVFFSITGEWFHKRFCPWLCDRTKVVHEVLFIHTDTIITDRQRVVCLVKFYKDLSRPLIFFKCIICES